MPWKRKKVHSYHGRVIFYALAAAVAGGILASMGGSLLLERGSALLNKYSTYRSVTGNYSDSEIKAAMEKRGIKAP